MELNKEPPTTLSNQKNKDKENFQFIEYSSFENIKALSNEIGIEIFKAYWKDTNTHVSLKKIDSQYLESLNLYRKLSYHQNILSIFGFSKEPVGDDYFLVTEYANGGNLRQYLRENQNLSWDDKMKLTIDATSGLQCIHSHDIVHLTLHPENVFVHNDRLLIGDFGLSRVITDISSSENIGMLPYIDPNFIANPSYTRDKKSDIYSLGFIMYEISSGKAPFASIRHNIKLSKKILSAAREKPVAGTPIEYIDLYEQCWDNDSVTRPSVDDVLARLGRMNLSPVYEDVEISKNKKSVDVKNENVKQTNANEKEVQVGLGSSSQDRIDSVILDFGGGIDSGYGGGTRKTNTKRKERNCQILPCLPKCRITFGVFLCWMCIILVIASFMLAFFLTNIIRKKSI